MKYYITHKEEITNILGYSLIKTKKPKIIIPATIVSPTGEVSSTIAPPVDVAGWN